MGLSNCFEEGGLLCGIDLIVFRLVGIICIYKDFAVREKGMAIYNR